MIHFEGQEHGYLSLVPPSKFPPPSQLVFPPRQQVSLFLLK